MKLTSITPLINIIRRDQGPNLSHIICYSSLLPLTLTLSFYSTANDSLALCSSNLLWLRYSLPPILPVLKLLVFLSLCLHVTSHLKSPPAAPTELPSCFPLAPPSSSCVLNSATWIIQSFYKSCNHRSEHCNKIYVITLYSFSFI